jgi:hypothetical protein
MDGKERIRKMQDMVNAKEIEVNPVRAQKKRTARRSLADSRGTGRPT